MATHVYPATRIEIIDIYGRRFQGHYGPGSIMIQTQDDDRTIKVFAPEPISAVEWLAYRDGGTLEVEDAREA